MDVFKTIKPNEHGSKAYTSEYGDKLVAVRYRKGSNPDRIYTTVEIIVDSKPYLPGITHTPAAKNKHSQLFPVKIQYHESELRAKIKLAGGRWEHKLKVWYLSYQKIIELKIKDRIIKD